MSSTRRRVAGPPGSAAPRRNLRRGGNVPGTTRRGGEERGRQAARHGGMGRVERAEESAVRVGSDLELRGVEAQSLGEERAAEAVDPVFVGRGRRRRRSGAGAARGSRRGGRRRRVARRPASNLSITSSRTGSGATKISTEKPVASARFFCRTMFWGSEIAMKRTFPESENGHARKRRRSLAGRHSTMSGSAERSVARDTPGQPVGLRERGRQRLLADGARREERPLDRPAVGLLPRGRAAQPADGEVPGLREEIPDPEVDGHPARRRSTIRAA